MSSENEEKAEKQEEVKTSKKPSQAKATKTKTATKPKAKKAPAKATKTKKAGKKLVVNNKTRFINKETADRKWYLFDAKDKNLGRLCGEIAKILRGKRKASFTPNCDAGDFVVVINAKEITFTGKNKADQTLYRRHTGYPGGLIEESLGNLLNRIPEKVIMNTVQGMMPKTKLGRAQLKKLKVYPGPEHPHAGQNPTIIEALPTV